MSKCDKTKEVIINEIKACKDMGDIPFALITSYIGIWAQLDEESRKTADEMEDEMKSSALDVVEQLKSGYVVNDDE